MFFCSLVPARAEYGSNHLNLSAGTSELAWFHGEDVRHFYHEHNHVATVHGNKDLSLIIPCKQSGALQRDFQFSAYERNPFYEILTIHAP
jgi:hypothetical protein